MSWSDPTNAPRPLGATLVVENRVGANGAVAMAGVAQAAPEGTTFALDAGGATTNPHLMRGLGFDYTIAFTPVTQATILPALLVVRGDSPIRDLAGFEAHLRANPCRESYGSSGIGTGSHLSGALLMRRANLQATHVPYRGGADQLTSIRRGDMLFTFSTIPTIAGVIRDGAIRPLVASAPQRAAAYPDVPTVAESGHAGFSIYDFHGIYAPAGTPADAVARMAAAVRGGDGRRRTPAAPCPAWPGAGGERHGGVQRIPWPAPRGDGGADPRRADSA